MFSAVVLCCTALHVPLSAQARSAHAARRRAPLMCSADEDAPEGELSLEKAFQERLAKEGGATNFKIRTDAARAAETVSDSLNKVVGSVKESSDKLLNAGAGRPASDGLLDQGQWKITVGFFALLIVLSVGNALLNSPPEPGAYTSGSGSVDLFTSDGGALQFGRQ